jgi:hypothetical protein
LPPGGGRGETGELAADYVVVDTGQDKCYNNTDEIACSEEGQTFYSQDAQYAGAQPSYVDNGDGTVTDLNTGLMWQKTPGDKVTFAQAVAGAESFNLAGYGDWRLPTIKELYSLIDFSGIDPSGWNGSDTSSLVPFIDTDYFDFEYGDTSTGERIIDAQYWSSTEYVGTTMGGSATTFGVNFADGRIKGYGREHPDGGEMTQFVRYVRGNPDYGVNDFVDNGDSTITDQATGLMWMQVDSGTAMTWEEALAYAEGMDYAGYDDWRLPNAKELQSIVDYSRSPGTTNSAAIDPMFSSTPITDEAGNTNYAFYWSSTTHANMRNGSAAAYVAFGEALGYMHNAWIDVHGAGAQRSDPKSGNPADYPTGHGPQGDAIRIYNYVRLVRDAEPTTSPTPTPPPTDSPPSVKPYMVYLPLVVKGRTQTENDDSPTAADYPGLPVAGGQSVSLPTAVESTHDSPKHPPTENQPFTERQLPAGTSPSEGDERGQRPNRSPIDLASAVEKLGITVEALREALGAPAGGPPGDGLPPGGPPGS